MTDPPTTPKVPREEPDASRIGRNLLSLAGGDALGRLVGFVGTVYLARVLGPERFGVLGFALALAGYLSVAVAGGLNAVGAREVARNPSDAPALAASVVAVRLLLAVAALACLGLVAWLLPKPDIVKSVVLLSGLSYFGLALNTGWVQRGLERNNVLAVSLVLSQVVSVGALFLFVAVPDDVRRVPPATFLGELLAAFFLARYVFRRRGFQADMRLGLRLLRSAGTLVVTRVMRTLLFTFDVVLLGFVADDHALGLYIASYRVCFVLTALTAAVFFSYLPSFTRAAREGTSAVSDLTSHSLALSLALGLPFVVGGILVAGPLLSTFFGPVYAEAAPVLGLLLVGSGTMLVQNTLRNVFLAYGRLRVEMWIMVVAAMSNIALNFLWIPRYGLLGAASATVAAEALILALCLVAVTRLGVRVRVSRPFGIVGAAGAMAAVLLLGARDLPIYLSVSLAAAMYLVALVVLRAVPRDAQPW